MNERDIELAKNLKKIEYHRDILYLLEDIYSMAKNVCDTCKSDDLQKNIIYLKKLIVNSYE